METMFRAYDIRGIYGKELTPQIANKIGKAYGTYTDASKICLGRDNRLSSDTLHDNLVKGLISTGLNVVDHGIVPTPLIYFSMKTQKYDGGIEITGSHNPSDFNGFKLNKADTPFFPEEIQEIRRIIEKNKFKTGKGKVEELDIIPDYIKYHVDNFKIKKPLKVVIDSGNGTTGIIAPKLFQKLGCEVVELYTELDGNFPNHFPNPSKDENLKDLQIKIKEVDADFGVGFDGDGDRAVFIDDKANILQGDQALAIFSRFILDEVPKARILMDVKCSNIIENIIKEKNGIPIIYKTGHSFIKRKLSEEKIALAGEVSGHFYFSHKYFGFDDGMHAAVRMAQSLSNQEVKLSQLFKEIPKNVTGKPKKEVRCSDINKFQVIEELKQELGKNHELITIDGVRINFINGWGLVRASNTEPRLVVLFEGSSSKHLEEIKSIFMVPLKEILEKHGEY